MSAPILATKLYIPPLRPRVVLRPRLIGRLNEGLSVGRRLSLVTAPAGFGKTTLVSEWLAECELIAEHQQQFGDRLPKEMKEQYLALKSRLSR